ncbi:MAG: hypothetical protein JWL86_7011 [Rhizobium sp.]|nr:hypothetical protein [Rhizobium sp.]
MALFYPCAPGLISIRLMTLFLRFGSIVLPTLITCIMHDYSVSYKVPVLLLKTPHSKYKEVNSMFLLIELRLYPYYFCKELLQYSCKHVYATPYQSYIPLSLALPLPYLVNPLHSATPDLGGRTVAGGTTSQRGPYRQPD